MIKKALLGTFVLLSCIVGITQATVLNMEVGETYNYNGASITCDNNANCVSEFGDTILTGLIQGNSLQYQIIIRVGDDIAYFKDYGTYNFSRRIMEGCFTSLTNGVNANDYILNSIPNCTNSSGNFNTWIENASTYGGKLTSLTFNTFGNQGLICWNYDEELGSFCVQFANNQYNEAYDWGMVSPITVEKLINIGMSDSPFIGGGDDVGLGTVISLNADLDEVITYYETRYNRNESMCYVGTNNLTGLWGDTCNSDCSFNEGTGKTMFELYYNIYSGYGNNIIKNVGSWINVGLINYSQWFYNNDNIIYLANYNGPDTNISLYYTGFSNPFVGKPFAYYFMSSNLYDGYSRESTQGEEMAYYCYLKLNYAQIQSGSINFDTVKDMVSSGINERIDDYYWSQINRMNTGVRLEPNGDYWTNLLTGEENIDLDLDNLFTDYFGKITSYFSNFSVSHSVGILPDYIVYALIFLILFRIMKH